MKDSCKKTRQKSSIILFILLFLSLELSLICFWLEQFEKCIKTSLHLHCAIHIELFYSILRRVTMKPFVFTLSLDFFCFVSNQHSLFLKKHSFLTCSFCFSLPFPILFIAATEGNSSWRNLGNYWAIHVLTSLRVMTRQIHLSEITVEIIVEFLTSY